MNVIIHRSVGLLIALPFLIGCGRAGTKGLTKAANPRPVIDSPAFESPSAAVKAWHDPYRQNGLEGHLRTTCNHEDILSRDSAEKILSERYAEWTDSGELEILEVIEREPYAAAVCRLNNRVDLVCLGHSDKGWHVARSLFSLVSVPWELTDFVLIDELAGEAHARSVSWARHKGDGKPPVEKTFPSRTIDSPAFATPQEAAQAWFDACKKDGEAGHVRVTFDLDNLTAHQWQPKLAEYDDLWKDDQVRVAEVMERTFLGAVILAHDDARLPLCLCRDQAGWHVSRAIDGWAFAWGSDYQRRRTLRKLLTDFELDVSFKHVRAKK